ncbi:MAG: hypothetical protein A2528_03505 [Candidatus Staskawiczbacteria bacterium RIFOXYD2_FULL_37_9]|uniref:Uncharacterized protein n=1 Tax=Candidatus Staskawiczbacteria bacterium RIFOXYB1_FULL_37_44 TaxID=1802223 RepID=A0A1G2IUR8_9BACT|nr:MAG: hypothetical protein A2358_02265 [Candidatus Staskawiczbacteria bacterium RIFOXYB1_FULL_37_44]OGZ82812.1 MAG: hypothetical protein A2416_03245 [Candidatus Staskawiczbacteria bacterium RIFOXYC1_FULL_37_52]OGZ89760.1 MAG: hypothetical protein A2444_01245 [Candidatus Staskawiczbacteria bacterium RIFOXYC2_FULL_37_19]OGZ90583.1 MAG: hypothetical protein A2581_02705 [Candidatus Staskawiczbacteria bacterium RIFOXYD1_FULL_37_110]OGZ93178.1 MAG: hypothetical protein A2528_03505 [Candidatus Stask
MAKSFLSNKNFQEFISKLNISEADKNILTSKVPQMDKEERLQILEVLKNIYLLDLEQTQALEKIQKNWQD